MRVLHPAIAVIGGGLVFMILRSLDPQGRYGRRAAGVAMAVIGAQFVAGIVNIALLTPLETQIVHLLLADTLWIAYLFLSFELLRRSPVAESTVAAPSGGAAA